MNLGKLGQAVTAKEIFDLIGDDLQEVEKQIARLAPEFGDRVVFTRFIAPEHPQGAWVPYYELWEFALVPPTKLPWQ